MFKKAYVVCIYLLDYIYVEASLRYRFKTIKTTPVEPILHRYTRAGPDYVLLSHKSLLQQSVIFAILTFVFPGEKNGVIARNCA